MAYQRYLKSQSLKPVSPLPYLVKDTFADVIKLRILKLGDCLAPFKCSQYDHKCPYERDLRGSESDRTQKQRLDYVSSLWKLERRNWNLPGAPRGDSAPDIWPPELLDNKLVLLFKPPVGSSQGLQDVGGRETRLSRVFKSWGGGRETRELSWWASASVNILGAELGEICRRSKQLCWPLASSAVESARAFRRDGHWELLLLPLARGYWSLLLFFLVPIISIHLSYNSAPIRSGGGGEMNLVLCIVPGKARKPGHHPALSLSEGSFFLAGEFCLIVDRCWPRRWGDTDKLKLLIFPCCVAILVCLFVCSTVLLKFPKWTPELSQKCLCVQVLTV